MSALALRAAFWAALPAALTAAGVEGARVEPPPARRGAVDGVVWVGSIDAAVSTVGTYKARIDVTVYGRGVTHPRLLQGTPEEAAGKVARAIGEIVAAALAQIEKRRGEEERLKIAARLTGAAGRGGRGPLVSVYMRSDDALYRIDSSRLGLSAEQVEATFALWRRLGVLPPLPVAPDGEGVARG